MGPPFAEIFEEGQRFSPGSPDEAWLIDRGRARVAPGICLGGAAVGAGNGWCMVTIKALAGLVPAQW